MLLDRNENDDGLGKYALVNLRKLQAVAGNPSTFERWTPEVREALATLSKLGVLELGKPGEQDEFFVIKLKDVHAEYSLRGYAMAAKHGGDEEFSREVELLADRSGRKSPFCKKPD